MPEDKLLNRKRKAKREGNKTLLASTCIDLAELYVSEDRFDEAIEEYLLIAEVYQQSGKPVDYARANRMIGEVYTKMREYDNAFRYLRIYLNVVKQQKHELEEQRARATIGHMYLSRYLDVVDNPDKTSLKHAYQSFMKSLFICEKLTGVNTREKEDMRARLLANLGVVEECQGNYGKGIELAEKSVEICKSQEFFEQLERGYTILGSLYVHKKEYPQAINQYNLAMEVAGRLKNKVQLVCASLSAKADILIKLSDFQSAKTVLLKAHKLMHPIASEREIIKQNLKIVAAMTYAEESLLTRSNSDFKTKKSNYEKLGDGACSLKNYSSAIEFYLKMLEAAVNAGESGRALSSCYISLAETYRDNKQFDRAIEYFKEDYGVSTPNTKDSITTLLNIADCLEASEGDPEEVETIYEQARTECLAAGLGRLEMKVLSRHADMLKKCGRLSQAAQLQNQMGKIEVVEVESDSEPSQEQPPPNIGNDISISDITDLSGDSDTEKVGMPRRTMRKRTKGLTVKRNGKGETQLHTACIKGNTELVRRLLDQGHPVNVRDNAGWLPMHEACNHGHIDIVKLLIEKGANVNDRGGTSCNGTTPLHDAAASGSLDIVQFLLDIGASAIIKNDKGEMPLHELKTWRSLVELDPADQILCDNLIERLTQAAEKSGHANDAVIAGANTAYVSAEARPPTRPPRRSTLSGKSPKKAPASGAKSKIGTLRKNLDTDDDLVPSTSKGNVEDCSSRHETNNVRDEYKRVMDSLRHPLREETVDKKRKSSETRLRSAYMEVDDVGDDWLDDDLAANQHKKRKSATADTFVNGLRMRGSSSGSLSRHSTSSSLNSKVNDDVDVPKEFFDADSIQMVNDSERLSHFISDDEEIIPSIVTSPRIKIKSQTTLIDQGFTRLRSFSPTNLSVGGNSTISKRKLQTKLTSFGHNSPVKLHPENAYNYMGNSQFSSYGVFNNEPTLSVDVRIDGRLYRVPVAASEIHTRTIKWLADESTKRYSRKECMKPTLELETKNGAILAEDDFISILFSAGATQAEEVQARVLQWNLPPLSDRYNEACANSSTLPNENLTKILQEASTSLNVSDMGLRNKTLGPLCKALNRQINLHHLNLSGNSLMNDSVQLLCLSLPTLNNLTVLNLSLNQLTAASLELLADMFTRSLSILGNLISLNLSHNPLGNECLKHLAIITRYLRLQTLNLSDVDFTHELFSIIPNRNVDLCLDYVVNLDIGYNQLRKQQIMVFLSWLKPHTIEKLNISNNSAQDEGLANDVSGWLNTEADVKLNLKSLDLSRCRVTDAELFELLRIPCGSGFTSFNLSYNEGLTAVTFRRLVQHRPTFLYLDLSGCDNILKYFEACTESTWSFDVMKRIRLSIDSDEHKREWDLIANMWMENHREKAKINKELQGFLELSVSD